MRGGLAAVTAALLGGCAFDPAGLSGSSPDARIVDADTISESLPDPPDAEEVPDAEPPDATVSPDPPCPVDDDLVACYRFENDVNATQPHDDTAFANNGTSSNVTFVTGRPGRGRAIQFGGTSATAIPDSPSLDVSTAMTLEAWIFVTGYPAAATRMGILDDDGQYGLFLLPGGVVRCSCAPGVADRLAVPLSTWTHIACTYDGAAITLYQDGVAAVPLAATGTIATASTVGTAVGQNSPTGEHLAGALDDLRIWRVALTGPEILDEATP